MKGTDEATVTLTMQQWDDVLACAMTGLKELLLDNPHQCSDSILLCLVSDRARSLQLLNDALAGESAAARQQIVPAAREDLP